MRAAMECNGSRQAPELCVCRARFERFIKTLSDKAEEVYVVTGVQVQLSGVRNRCAIPSR